MWIYKGDIFDEVAPGEIEIEEISPIEVTLKLDDAEENEQNIGNDDIGENVTTEKS